MAARYWVGGTNTWNGTLTGKWATTSGGANGASVPTAADDVYFDASSTGVCTVATGMVCRSINFTGFTGTFSIPASTNLNIGDATAGAGNVAILCSAGMTLTVGNSGTSIILFNSTSATQQTITSNGKVFPSMTFTTAGNWVQGDALTATSAIIQVNLGTFSTGNFALTCGLLNSSNTNVRTITLGTSTVNFSRNGQSGLNFGVSTNLTLNASSSTIISNTSNSDFYAGTGFTYNIVSIQYGNGSGVISAPSCTFVTLTLKGGNQARLILGNDFTTTNLEIISSAGNSVNVPICLSNISGTQRTINVTNTPIISNVILRDIRIVGSGTPYATTRTGDAGNNTGMTLSPARTLYWRSGATTYANTNTWSTTAHNGAAGADPAMPQDTIIFEADVVPGSNTFAFAWQGIPTLDFTNVTASGLSVNFTNTNGYTYSHGDIILKTGMTIAGTGSIAFIGYGNQKLDLKGISMPTTYIGQDKPTGTKVYLGSDFVTPNTLNIASNLNAIAADAAPLGEFDANGYNVTCNILSSSNSNTRTITMGTGLWTTTAATGSTIINLTTATNLTFNRGTQPFKITGLPADGTVLRTIILNGLTEANSPSVWVSEGGGRLNVNGGSVYNLDFTGSTAAFTNNIRTVYGNITFASGMTYETGTNALTLAATSGVQEIRCNGMTINVPVNLSGAGGTVRMMDNFLMSNLRQLTLNNGTLDANNFNLTMGVFAASNSNVRSIIMGSGTWYITGVSGTIWNCTGVTNLTVDVGTSTVDFSNFTPGNTRTYAPGFPLYDVKVSVGTDTFANSGIGMTNHTLDFTGFSGTWDGNGSYTGSLILGAGMTIVSSTNINTMTGTGSIITNGVAIPRPLNINTSGTITLGSNFTMTAGRTLSLIAGTFNADSYNVVVPLFNSSGTGVRTLNMGTGTWEVTGSGTTVWNNGTGTNLTIIRNPTGVNLTYSGSAGVRTIAQADVGYAGAPSINVTAGSDTIGISNARLFNLNFTGFSGALSNATRALYGSLTLSAGMTITGGALITSMLGTGSSTITSNGQTIDFPITIGGVGGTVTLADNLTLGTTRTLTVSDGTFNANNMNVTAGALNASGSNTRTITMGSGTWTLTNDGTVLQFSTMSNLTLNVGTSTIVITDASANTKTIAHGGTLTLYNLTIQAGGTGAVIFGANSLVISNNFTVNGPKTLSFTSGSGSTTTFQGAVSMVGTAGNPITLTSTAAFYLSKASGTVNGDYLVINNSQATGGAVWNAGANSVDGGGNAGWVFPGLFKYYNGTSFVNKSVKYWDGSAWVQKPVKTWNGSAWVAGEA